MLCLPTAYVPPHSYVGGEERLNQGRYETKPVGAAAIEKAEQVARTLYEGAVALDAP